MKKILAFDTSNNSCSVAISEGQNIIAYLEELRPSMQAERIMPMIEEALTIAKLGYQDLDCLAVTKGPGSFTGIRTGLAAAKGILIAANIKAVTVTNFDIMHYRAKVQIANYDKIYVLLNAFKNQLYIQVFDNNDNAYKPKLVDFEEIIVVLAAEKGQIICTGSGLEPIYQKIKSCSDLILLPRFTRVKAMHICRYVDDMLNNDSKNNRLSYSIEPLYIRPPDAKIN